MRSFRFRLRFVLIFLIALSVVFSAYFYTGKSVFGLIPPGSLRNAAWSVLILAFVALPLTLLSRLFYERLPGFETIAWIAYTGFGFVTLLLSFFLLRDVALLFLSLLEYIFPALSEFETLSRRSLDSGILLIVAVLALYGFHAARKIPVVRRVDVAVKDLHPDLDGYRIVQLSDVHIGPTIKRQFVESIVQKANSLNPDLLAITGDLVDGSVEELRDDSEPLSRLSAKDGVYFVLGNHEYYSGAASWVKEVTGLGIRVLINEHVQIKRRKARLLLGGVTDIQAHAHIPSHASDPHAALRGSVSSHFKLLLAHQPRSAFEASEAGFDLVLCGHTHGGQYFPGNLLVRLVQPFSSGLHRFRNLWVYTSRGTGYWGPPLRLGAPSEITEIVLCRC